jgi:aminoglycoside 6'-N-acetyltransferase I
MMRVREFQDSDWDEWRRMDQALFPDNEFEEDLEADMRALLARPDAAVFIAERSDGSVCGYVEVGARAYADGCRSSPVGYIEAWYVDPDVRRSGYGRALLDAAEAWARGRGYTEMASDARLDNIISINAHENSGYQAIDHVVQFRKALTSADPRKASG